MDDYDYGEVENVGVVKKKVRARAVELTVF
jgi:hypothetical protein